MRPSGRAPDEMRAITIETGYTTYGCVFHYILFIRENSLIGALTHECRLVEPTQTQFQFSGISIHIANSIDPRNIGLVL